MSDIVRVEGLSDTQRLLLMAAYDEGARPGSRHQHCRTVLVRALLMAGRWDYSVPVGEVNADLEEFYGVLIAMIAGLSSKDALFVGAGDLATPAYPDFTSCRLTNAGARVARALLKQYRAAKAEEIHHWLKHRNLFPQQKEIILMAVKPIRDGYATVTPYLIVRDAAKALDFYKRAFGATELYRLAAPDGKVLHSEMQVGNSRIMMAEEVPQMNARSPQSLGGSPVTILLYVEGVDTRVQQATAAGAKVVRPLQDQFYGDRSATLEDPFGHVWTVATHIEDVPPAEIQKRAEAMMKQHKGG